MAGLIGFLQAQRSTMNYKMTIRMYSKLSKWQFVVCSVLKASAYGNTNKISH